MARRLATPVFDFLDALAYDNPAPSEPWISEGDFDPRFPRRVLEKAEHYSLIEIDRSERSPDDLPEDGWLFRFTAEGRRRFAAEAGLLALGEKAA